MKSLMTILAISCLPLLAQANVPNIALIRQDVLAILEDGFAGSIPVDDVWTRLDCTVSVRQQLLTTAITIESEGEKFTFTLSHDSKVTKFESNLREAPVLSYRSLTVRKLPESATDPVQLEVTKTANDREYLVSIEYPDAIAAKNYGRKTSVMSCGTEY